MHKGVDRWGEIVAKIRVVRSADQARELLRSLADPRAARILGFVNAHALNSCADNAAFFNALAGADILLRDGSGMALLYRKLRLDPGLNMNGTDFIPKILAEFRGRRVAIWGTTEPFLSRATLRCESDFGVHAVSTENGFEGTAHYLELSKRAQADLIVLGMGMPRQEELAQQLKSTASNSPLIICGGAILDFLGGKVARAPRWMRAIGAEWLYRLYREPKRLFTRYVLGNPVFMLRLIGLRRKKL
jgi:N-acetylglucosaminyldiphosphoundecaprenol N-acetyl-beta-D-mannosaminyltransferase